MNKNLEKIRAACIKANPSINERQLLYYEGGDVAKCIGGENEPIQLSDVLLAIKKYGIARKQIAIDSMGRFLALYYSGAVPEDFHWNLNKTLDDQPQQTIDFIAYLL